jgi:hypothetical protein
MKAAFVASPLAGEVPPKGAEGGRGADGSGGAFCPATHTPQGEGEKVEPCLR